MYINLLTFIIGVLVFLAGCSNNNWNKNHNHLEVATINANLAIYYLGNKLPHIAKYKAIKSINLEPRLPIANLAMAYYLAYVKENNFAEKYFLAAIKYSRNSAKYLHAYGDFICENNIYADNTLNLAMEKFNLAAKHIGYVDIASLYASMACCCAKYNLKQSAKLYLSKAIAHNYTNKEKIKNISILIIED